MKVNGTVKEADLSNVYGIYEKSMSVLENEQQQNSNLKITWQKQITGIMIDTKNYLSEFFLKSSFKGTINSFVQLPITSNSECLKRVYKYKGNLEGWKF